MCSKSGRECMKLKIVHAGMPEPVVRRFPHLQSELHEMAMKDESFSQLCHDYEDVVGALKHADIQKSDTRSDLLGLKTTLEVEILEQVSLKGTLKRN
jgi:hypothetical protein